MPKFSIAPYRARTARAFPFGRSPSSSMVRYNTYGRLARASKLSLARSRTRTMQKRRKRGTFGLGVTEQHDARRIYTKGYMPRRTKRRWRSFSKKVLAVSEKGLGSQTWVSNTYQQISNTTAGNQLLFNCGLYTSTSSTNSVFNDLDQIGTDISNAATTVASGLAVGQSSKIIFKSAVLDLTIRNASTFTDGANVNDATGTRMEVDVYELTCNRGDEEGAIYPDILSLFAQNPTRNDPIGGTGTEVALTLRGVTPFDLTYSLSNFKMKILRKTKYVIAQGDQVTYQMRDPGRHVKLQRELTSNEGPVYPGLTRIILVVGKISPGIPVGPGDQQYQEILDMGITRKYFFKVENWTEDRTIYHT